MRVYITEFFVLKILATVTVVLYSVGNVFSPKTTQFQRIQKNALNLQSAERSVVFYTFLSMHPALYLTKPLLVLYMAMEHILNKKEVIKRKKGSCNVEKYILVPNLSLKIRS